MQTSSWCIRWIRGPRSTIPAWAGFFTTTTTAFSKYGSRLAASDTVDEFPGLTVVYLRLAWAYLEPEEGHFNWSVVDTPAQRWIAKGKKVALRFTTSETGQMYATPEWVRKAGAQGTFTKNRQVVTEGGVWEPNFDDPVFLEKLERFMAAAGRRYDGNPNIAFVDVGTLGVWGEGHSFATTLKQYPTHHRLQTHRPAPQVLPAHPPRDQRRLCGPGSRRSAGTGRDRPARARRSGPRDYGFEKGLTLRDDSILVQAGPRAYFHANMAKAVWHDRPVILESEHYGLVCQARRLAGRQSLPRRDRGLPRELRVDSLVAAGVPAGKPRPHRPHQSTPWLPHPARGSVMAEICGGQLRVRVHGALAQRRRCSVSARRTSGDHAEGSRRRNRRGVRR